LIFGLILYSLGLTLSINANIGLAPWDAFTIGISYVSNISYGTISIITGIFILFIIVMFLKEKIGVGTILNTILIGIFVDLFQSFKIIPYMNNFFLGIIMLLAGQLVVSLASYFYISTGLGCGPRDSLMVGLSKKFARIPVGAIRGGIEGTVLVIGYILGAKVGIGTIIAVFGIGIIIQTTFKFFNFDVKSIVHESIFQTATYFKKDFIKTIENE
jgi:uncharacterized membrane protein YczE